MYLVGTGKYKLQAIDIGSQMELKKNEEWWDISNKNLRIGTITVRIYASVAELYNAYKLGGLDMLITNSPNIEEHIGMIGSDIQESYGRNFDYLALNCNSNILSYKEVRQALNYGIDKQGIVNSVYGGKYKIAEHPLAYGNYLYNKEKESYEHNVEKAKQILQSGGWEFSYGNWQKRQDYTTARLRLNLVVQGTNEARVNVANMIKDNLAEVGIPVNVIAANDWTYENYLKNKNYDILLTRCNSTE